jgi:DNA invertase Pin-like site-specific DNA recombinase
MEKIKVVCYYRVSTKGQGESGLGLEAQRAYIGHFVASNAKYEIVKELTEVATAKYMDCETRPLLCEALEMCKANGYYLAVAKLDRLSRNTQHVLTIFEKLKERLVSCDIPNVDKFTLTIFAAIAEREREMIGIRTKQALDARKERTGEWRKGGYNDDARAKGTAKNQRKAATNTNTSKAKNYATMLRTSGKTFEQIADILNGDGHLTATGKAFDKALVKYLIDK